MFSQIVYYKKKSPYWLFNKAKFINRVFIYYEGELKIFQMSFCHLIYKVTIKYFLNLQNKKNRDAQKIIEIDYEI